jgi:DNA-binding CsgD family transcriptional regulator
MMHGTLDDPLPCLPEWVDTAEWPVWVTGADGRMTYLNDSARELLGNRPCVGNPCYSAVRGYTNEGEEVCSERCPVLSKALAGTHQGALRMHVGDPLDESSWALVFPMAMKGTDSRPRALLHLAYRLDREQRFEEYLRRVASRSGSAAQKPAMHCLTPREREVLDLLARDLDPQSIASHLDLSYTTVRNHIQHILEKLDAHSSEEAVARWLLDD